MNLSLCNLTSVWLWNILVHCAVACILAEPAGCQTPPLLENGDLKHPMKDQYSHNERVEYVCQAYHTLEGDSLQICINGEWIGQRRCLSKFFFYRYFAKFPQLSWLQQVVSDLNKFSNRLLSRIHLLNTFAHSISVNISFISYLIVNMFDNIHSLLSRFHSRSHCIRVGFFRVDFQRVHDSKKQLSLSDLPFVVDMVVFL